MSDFYKGYGHQAGTTGSLGSVQGYAQASAKQQQMANEYTNQATLNPAPPQPASGVLVNGLALIHERNARIAERLARLENTILGAIPETASRSEPPRAKEYSGMMGEAEDQFYAIAGTLNRIETALNRLETFA